MDTKSPIDSAVELVIEDFQKYPQCYFTEEDIRWRLMREIEEELSKVSKHRVKSLSGITSAVHGEYPTPFRCTMEHRSFDLARPTGSQGQRGHFDIVVLNHPATAKCELEIIRSQDYTRFFKKLRLRELPLPFLDCVIEIKLFRAQKWTKSTEQRQMEYACQAVSKVAATLHANDYYPEAFAKRGIVLLFDNSDLASTFDIEFARDRFREVFKATPDTLSCVWLTPQKRVDFRG